MGRIVDALSRGRSALARGLSSIGVRPNHLTVLGFVLACWAGWFFHTGAFRLAALLVLLSALCDFLDGMVARVGNRISAFGAFLDSSLDRYSDAAVIGGIMLYYASLGADRYVMLALAALAGALLTSYTRARAESLIDRCDVGIFERPERLVVLMAAGATGRVAAGLWILAVAGNITVVQRMVHVWLSLRERGSTTQAGKSSDESGTA